MHVVLVHNYYLHAGGEDVAVAAEAALLREQGHRVDLFEVRNDRLTSWPGKLRAIFATPYSSSSRKRFAAMLLASRPDTGLHFEPGNPGDLAMKVCWLRDNPEACRRMGAKACQRYEEKYTPEKNYQIGMKIYQEAGRRKEGGAPVVQLYDAFNILKLL